MTPQPSPQLPEEVKPPYKISEREPVFPCWLWGCINIIYPSPVEHWRKHSDMPNAGLHYLPGRPDDKLRPGVFLATHWSPDQPTAPTGTPYLAPRPPAPRDAEYSAEYALEEIGRLLDAEYTEGELRTKKHGWIAAILYKFHKTLRHAPADSASAQLAAMREERDELNRRLEEQHKLYCEETKRHNETWAKIHAATGYLNKEFKKLPEDLLEAVKEVVFRVTLVELGRNSLQGEVAELRDKRKQLIEKLRESVNDTRELNDLAEALVAERTDLRAQLAAAQSEVGRLTKERDELDAELERMAGQPGSFAERDRLMRELATLRRERDELRAELLTTHQMACRVGLERDELRAKQGEAP